MNQPETEFDTNEGETSDESVMEQLAAKRKSETEEVEDDEEAEGPAVEGADVEDDEDEAEEAPAEEVEDEDPEIDLGDMKVRKSELKAGYMKNADYTQKSQAAAEATRNAQAIEARARQEREYYANQVNVTLQLAHKQLIGDQQALAELAQTDPAEWVAQNAAFQQRAQQFNALVQTSQAISHQQKADDETQQSEYVANERKALKDKLPEWKNPEVAKQEQTGIAQFLLERGYSQEDLASMQDHRAFLIVRDAWKAQQASKARESAKAKQSKPNPPQTVKPGAAKNNQQSGQTDYDAALKRAKRTGSEDDVMALLAAKRKTN